MKRMLIIGNVIFAGNMTLKINLPKGEIKAHGGIMNVEMNIVEKDMSPDNNHYQY